MQSLLCVMPAMFMLCQTMFPSVKEQPFMYLTTQLTEHYSKGVVLLHVILLTTKLEISYCCCYKFCYVGSDSTEDVHICTSCFEKVMVYCRL